MKLKILSGGAAFGLVQAYSAAFKRKTGYSIAGDYGAVGGMKDRILAGEAVDLIILTRAIIEELANKGKVDPQVIIDVGKVETGVAVRSGETFPPLSDGKQLREALLAADAIYLPDQKLATAGIHFAKVLVDLEIDGEVSGRLHPYPNGATAMAAMAASSDKRPIGCTQVTEILNTPGVDLVAPLPKGYELATIYTTAVSARAALLDAAKTLAFMLTAADAEAARIRAGFRA